MTLNVLEEYLKAFAGCVVVVSHDRFFMDKIVDHLFVFEGDGEVSDFPGNYTVYRNYSLEKEAKEQTNARAIEKKKNEERKVKRTQTSPEKLGKRKFTFAEKREFELLESEIAELEEQKNALEELLNSGELPHTELYEKSKQLEKLKTVLDEKELRWLELSEIE